MRESPVDRARTEHRKAKGHPMGCPSGQSGDPSTGQCVQGRRVALGASTARHEPPGLGRRTGRCPGAAPHLDLPAAIARAVERRRSAGRGALERLAATSTIEGSRAERSHFFLPSLDRRVFVRLSVRRLGRWSLVVVEAFFAHGRGADQQANGIRPSASPPRGIGIAGEPPGNRCTDNDLASEPTPPCVNSPPSSGSFAFFPLPSAPKSPVDSAFDDPAFDHPAANPEHLRTPPVFGRDMTQQGPN